jgi:hypothetical protein
LTNVSLPEVDNPGIPVSDEELQPTPEEEAALKEIESQQAENTENYEKTPEQVEADNIKIKKAAEEAAKNPDIQPVQAKPEETEPAPTEPKRDADGYIYTKEQAVKNFTTLFKKYIDTGDAAYTDALLSAKRDEGENFSQEEFDGDVQLMLTDPYSDPHLAGALDHYRSSGNLGSLILSASEWLACGGRDAVYAERSTQ